MPESTPMSESERKEWNHRSLISADAAQGARDMSTHYADDARRAFQRRIDTISSSEAMANQRADTDKIAQAAMQTKTSMSVPPFVPGYWGGPGPGGGKE